MSQASPETKIIHTRIALVILWVITVALVCVTTVTSYLAFCEVADRAPGDVDWLLSFAPILPVATVIDAGVIWLAALIFRFRFRLRLLWFAPLIALASFGVFGAAIYPSVYRGCGIPMTCTAIGIVVLTRNLSRARAEH